MFAVTRNSISTQASFKGFSGTNGFSVGHERNLLLNFLRQG